MSEHRIVPEQVDEDLFLLTSLASEKGNEEDRNAARSVQRLVYAQQLEIERLKRAIETEKDMKDFHKDQSDRYFQLWLKA